MACGKGKWPYCRVRSIVGTVLMYSVIIVYLVQLSLLRHRGSIFVFHFSMVLRRIDPTDVLASGAALKHYRRIVTSRR